MTDAEAAAGDRPEGEDYRRHLVRGSAWMVAMRWAMRGIGLVSTIILARILSPDDFGIVAMAMVVIGFLEVFTHTGVDLALIRKAELEREDLDTAWTFEILKGAALAAVLFVVAPYAGAYYDEPRVVDVIRALGFGALILGFENIGVVAFRRDLDFAKEFRFNVYQKLLSFGLGVGLAVALGNYWALVAGILAGRVMTVGLSYRMHPYRPGLTLTRLREIWSFSQWVLVGRIGRYLNNNTDAFIVGGLSGTKAIGNYAVASSIATAPSTELVLPMARGLYPVYARLADDPEELARSYLNALSAITLFCIAAGFGLYAVAEDVVAVLLGPKWVDAVPLMEWLALFGAVGAAAISVDALLTASGHVRLMSGLVWLQFAAALPAMVVAGQQWGAVGVAAAKTIVVAAILPVVFVLVARATAVGFGRVAGVLWPRLVAGGAMVAAVKLCHLETLASPFLRLPMDIAVGAVTFTATTYLLWRLGGRRPGPEAAALDAMGRLLRRARPA